MEYNWKVWGKFGLLYGAVVGLLALVMTLGFIAIATDIINNINNGGNGVFFGAVTSFSGITTEIQNGIASITPTLIVFLMVFIPILAISGAISLIVNTAILHYAGAHVSGYNSLLLLSIFIPTFGVAVNGLISLIMPSYTITFDPVISIILGFFMTWVSISLAYLIWTEGFKQPASTLSY